VITVSSLDHPDQVPSVRAGRQLLASVDVEWTKNYTIRNGNKPFCVSVVYLDLPQRAGDLSKTRFEFTSAYLEPQEPTAALVARADALMRTVLDSAQIITGHQVCSDFAVLAATADGSASAVDEARTAWHARRVPDQRRRVIDTRFDAGHLLTGKSRRLVDVATELGLDVTQPELRGTSMTALHRAWLEHSDTAAREKISVLNLRHSLSTGLVAARAADRGRWKDTLNVNQLLADRAAGSWTWLDSPTFRALLEETP
jgi:hypothetical protein